jgi:chromosome segregation ATPase
LAERALPRTEAEAQLAELSNRMSRLEQLEWRIPPAAWARGEKATVSLTMQRSVAQLEELARSQAAQLAEVAARQTSARPAGAPLAAPPGLTAADVAGMIEQAIAAASRREVAPSAGDAAQQGQLEELRLGAAAMNRRMLACEELAADAAVRTQHGLADAVPAMEQRLTEIAVSECGRALREEIGGLRARCTALEDELDAERRSTKAALEHGLAQLSDALRAEVSATNSGLCRAEDLREAATELRASLSVAQDAAAKDCAELRAAVTEQLAAAAALARNQLGECSSSLDRRMQSVSEQLEGITVAVEAVESGTSVRFEETAAQLTQMATAVDAQIDAAAASIDTAVHTSVGEATEAFRASVSELEDDLRRLKQEQEDHQNQIPKIGALESQLSAELSALRSALESTEASMGRRMTESDHALAALGATVEGVRAERTAIDNALAQIRDRVASSSDATATVKRQLQELTEGIARSGTDQEDWRREIGTRWSAIHSETLQEL